MRRDLAYGIALVALLAAAGMIVSSADELCAYGTIMDEGEIRGALWRVVCRPERGVQPFSLEVVPYGADEWIPVDRFAHVDQAREYAGEYLTA